LPNRASARRTNSGSGSVAPHASGSGTVARPAARKPTSARRPVRKPKRLPRLGEPGRRLRISTAIVLALFAVIGIRLVELQLTDARAYAAKGLSERLQTVPVAAPRGAIYDRNGAILVQSVEARYAYADPGLVADPHRTAEALSPLLAVPVSELVGKLARHNRADGTPVRFEWLARGLDIDTGERIRALNLAGIGVRRDERRDAPGHDLASNLLGFTGRDLTGLAGLEEGYERQLRGVDGERTFEIGDGNLAKEIPGGYHVEKPARPGTSLRLTIDRDLQYQVQSILADRMRDRKAYFATAIVLDVHTGDVLAQASYPTYDADDPLTAPEGARLDAATQITVDPGSVAKVVALGAALQEGVVHPDSTVPVAPSITKGGQRFEDHTKIFPAGTKITLPAILAYSSNVGTITVASQLGADRLYDYQRKFGLGQVTGEGMPGESPGLIQPPARWSGPSYGSIPIGDSIAVTPLQMAAIYATIANNGVWVQPHVVQATVAPGGKPTPCTPPRTRQVLSADNATAMRSMLEAVVTMPGATGRSAAIPGYRVAGKTGTGIRVIDGRYAQGEVGSFIGMAPADAPRYVIAVFAHTPAGTGGVVAAPAFRDMMAFTLDHYQVPPTGTTPPTFAVTG
jgi:cell division protein FtsI (penicillin-binding protein 3)